MRRLGLVSLCMALAGCQVPQSVSNGAPIGGAPINYAAMLDLPHYGTSFTGTVPFLHRTVALPPGTWRFASTSVMSTKLGPAAATLTLAQYDGPVLHSLLVLAGNVRSGTGNFVNPLCQTSDVIWNDIRQAVPGGAQDCSAIFFERPALWRDHPGTQSANLAHALDLMGVQTPNVVIGAAVHESTGQWFLSEILYQNPDIAGIAPDMATQRAQSAWTPFNIPKDPLKPPFIDQLKAAAAAMRIQLQIRVNQPGQFVPGSGETPA